MTVKDTFKASIDMGLFVTKTYIEDLSDADLLVRPVKGMNHIAWQLGHLVSSTHQLMSSVGVKMPELPAGVAEAHSRDTTGVDDPSKFLTKARYVELLDSVHAAAKTGIDATPDAKLDDPAPEAVRSYCPTVGSVFNLIGQHLLMHAGQYVAVRRLRGKPVRI